MDPDRPEPRDSPRRPRLDLLVACAAVAVALCVWGAIGWRRAYRAQAKVDHLAWLEQHRDAALLRMVVRGGEAAAQMALEGAADIDGAHGVLAPAPDRDDLLAP